MKMSRNIKLVALNLNTFVKFLCEVASFLCGIENGRSYVHFVAPGVVELRALVGENCHEVERLFRSGMESERKVVDVVGVAKGVLFG